jgi:hypothetical protein
VWEAIGLIVKEEINSLLDMGEIISRLRGQV